MGSKSGGRPQQAVSVQTPRLPIELQPLLFGGAGGRISGVPGPDPTFQLPGGQAVPFQESLLGRTLTAAGQRPEDVIVPRNIFGFAPTEQLGQQIGIQQALQPSPLSLLGGLQLGGIAGGGGLRDLIGDPTQRFEARAGNVLDLFRREVQAPTLARFARGGGFGGSAQAEFEAAQQGQLFRQLAQIQQEEEQRQFGNLLAAQQQQLQAFRQIPAFAQLTRPDPQQLLQIGGAQRGLQQQIADQLQQEAARRAQFPREQLGVLGQGLGLFPGTAGGVTQQPLISQGPSPLAGAIGGGFTGLGALGGLAEAGLLGTAGTAATFSGGAVAPAVAGTGLLGALGPLGLLAGGFGLGALGGFGR